MRKWIYADYTVPFTPGVTPHVQPLTNPGGKSYPRRATTGILSARMLFFSHNNIPYPSVNGKNTRRISGRLTQPVEVLPLKL